MIVIMGMHRSGTSLTALLVHSAGYEVANTLQANEWNPDGYWEDADFMTKNDRILSFNGGKWDNPPDVMQGKYEFDINCDAIKDPRLCLTYPVWEFPPHKIIKVWRNKADVVKSLSRRDDKPIKECERLYDTYVDRMKRYNGVPVLNVRYEDLKRGKVRKFEKFIDGKVDKSLIR